MTPWRGKFTEAEVRAIARRTEARYRPLGPIGRALAKRKAARLRAGHAGAPTGVEVDNTVTLRAVELIGEGWEPTAAFARAAREVARTGGVR